jgi:hypothetical protein
MDKAVAESFFATIKPKLIEIRPQSKCARLEHSLQRRRELVQHQAVARSPPGYPSLAADEAIHRYAIRQAA